MTDNPLLKRWMVWDRKNPEFWPLFQRFAYEAVQSGRRRYSGWLIVGRIRWETSVVMMGPHDDFKISNDFIALYTRRFRWAAPQHAELFEVNAMRRATDEEIIALLEKRRPLS